MFSKHRTVCLALAALGASVLLLATGCGEDDAASSILPYDDDETVVIGPDGQVVTGETPDGSDCIRVDDDTCIRPQEECGEDQHADVFLDSEGNVVEILCYPREGDAVIVEGDDGDVSIGDNGAVVILDADDFDGDVVIEGNRGTVYGDSPGEAVIDGNLDFRGNESTVRGITVTGDVTMSGNKSVLGYCIVLGDIILSGGENLITNCIVFGSIRSSGNADRIVANHVQGEMTFSGPPSECRDNWRFVDRDDDFVLDEAEADEATPFPCD